MFRLEDYRELVGDRVLHEIYRKARRLYNKRIIHVNSTYTGGGVAEILNSLIPMFNEIGVYAGWRIFHGYPDFFSVTKKMHNALQGQSVTFNKEELDLYKKTNKAYSVYTHINHDVAFIHDPQPLPMIDYYTKSQPWIWRCHIDVSKPTQTLDYLKQFMLKYDKMIISSKNYVMEDFPVEYSIIQPAIDPSTIKNKKLNDYDINRCLNKFGIPTDKPIITQVSRFDKWKQPGKVLEIFRKVKEKVDCRLVLCGSMASDDPEGLEIYEDIKNKADDLNGDIFLTTVESNMLVNSLQSISDVVIQFSSKEGFGLTVTEAMFKEKPVIATNVGGIPLQITDEYNGLLVEPTDIDGAANRIIEILKNKKFAKKLGQNARKSVIDNFLMTRLLTNYIDLIIEILK